MGTQLFDWLAPGGFAQEAARERKLRKAVALHQFELRYQPKVCAHTCRIEGVEALLRWRDPGAGLLSPAEFLPLLESSGLILELGEWIVDRAMRDCRHWGGLGLPPMRVSLNISKLQLHQPDFARRFLELARPWASNMTGLDLEINEDALLGDGAADIKKLALLRSAGIRVAIDDFGSGISSLSTLCALPIDSLKIDTTFIHALTTSRAAQAMVWTIISLARGLGVTAIAEGVETQEQLEMLRQMGCDQSQGYLHSQPLDRNEMARLLQSGKGWLQPPREIPGGASWQPRNAIRVNAF